MNTETRKSSFWSKLGFGIVIVLVFGWLILLFADLFSKNPHNRKKGFKKILYLTIFLAVGGLALRLDKSNDSNSNYSQPNNDFKEITAEKSEVEDSINYTKELLKQEETFSEQKNEKSASLVVMSPRAHFYKEPDRNQKRSAYVIASQKVNLITSDKEFFYGSYTNESGTVTRGWLLKSDFNF